VETGAQSVAMSGGGRAITSLTFDAPPVRVAQLSLWFLPIRDLQTLDLAELRVKWRDLFPQVRERPPSQPWTGETEDVKFFDEQWPMPACLFRNFEGDREVLIQQDRFILTWRFDSAGSKYPGFANLFGQMTTYFEAFNEAIERTGNERPTVARVGLRYRNKIEGVDPQVAAEFLVLGKPLEPTIESRDRDSVRLSRHYCPTDDNRQVVLQVSVSEGSNRYEEASHEHTRKTTSLRIESYTSLNAEKKEDAFDRLRDVHDSAIETFLALAGPELRKIWGERHVSYS